MNLIVSCDPGTKQCAFTVLTPGPRNRPHVIASAMVDSTPEDLGAYLDYAETLGAMDAVGIEWIDGFVFEAFRAKALLASQGVAGELSGIAWSRGFRVEKVKAQTWRDAFVGRAPKPIKIPGVKAGRAGKSTDDMIARKIPLWVSGTEDFGAASHKYDACGVALWASRIVWGNQTLATAKAAFEAKCEAAKAEAVKRSRTAKGAR